MKIILYPFLGSPCCEKMHNWKIDLSFFRLNQVVCAQSIEQADMLFIVGKIAWKQAPFLKQLWEKMAVPSQIIHLIGGHNDLPNYSIIPQLSSLIPISTTLEQCSLSVKELNQLLTTVTLQ